MTGPARRVRRTTCLSGSGCGGAPGCPWQRYRGPAELRTGLGKRSGPSTAVCIAYCDTVLHMAQAVSVRLDDEVQQALRTLEASGMSRSEAIRKSILDAAAGLRRHEALRAEVAVLEADEEDQREMWEVASLMESLRAEG